MLGVFSLQGIISEEKLTGTLAWILSKPVPSSAFYLAKLISQMIVTFVISVLVQGMRKNYQKNSLNKHLMVILVKLS